MVRWIALVMTSVIAKRLSTSPSNCTNEIKPVCSSDGVTYSNLCLFQGAQEDDNSITKISDSPCPSSTCPTNCTEFDVFYGGYCGSNGISYWEKCDFLIDQCKFPSLTITKLARCKCDTTCSSVKDQVCGSDGITYMNKCHLANAKCINKNLELIDYGSSDKYGPCLHGTKEFCMEKFGTIDDKPMNYCGTDNITYTTKGSFRLAMCTNESLKMLHPRECGCNFKGCSKVTIPVCGSDGITYQTGCDFDFAQCGNLSLRIASSGSCPTTPTMTPPATAKTGTASTYQNAMEIIVFMSAFALH